MVIMVMCPRCRVEKGLEEFGRNRAAKTGRQVYCFECRRQRAREDRRFAEDPPNRYARNPSMFKAHVAVARAIQSGRLERPAVCPVCQVGGRLVEAHHWLGYAKRYWLRVRWMCRSCHHRLHRNDR